MKRLNTLFCLAFVLWGLPLFAQDVATEAKGAANALADAITALEAAESSKDRVAALTTTIRAYEQGLGALRESLRQVQLKESALELQLEARRDEVSQLVGVLTTMEQDPTPLLLLHPLGPLGTVRSGMMLADVAPAVQAEADRLKAELEQIRDLRQLQAGAADVLQRGLGSAQAARTALSQAISDRVDLPKKFTEDPEALRSLLESADTLGAFAAGLAPTTEVDGDQPGFSQAAGQLPLPVLGRVILHPGEADAAGVRRPGVTLATRPGALVTAPWSATIRYLGPLLDYGNVIVLEPGDGYLLVLAGMKTVYGEVGEVVAAGAPLGLMGGTEPGSDEFLASASEGGGIRDTETFYMELREGGAPVDPANWFELIEAP